MRTAKQNLRIFICGVDSTPDPYSGVSVARSLRLAFPHSELIAVDRSPASSGLEWPDFDSTSVFSNRRFLANLCKKLAGNEYLIPCVDDEIQWLGGRRHLGDRVLMPGNRCLQKIQKPADDVARMLGMKTPASLLLPCRPRSLAGFLAKSGPQVWWKGRIAGAKSVAAEGVGSRKDAVLTRKSARGKKELLQQHIHGRLEQMAFAAYKGRLLGGVWMRKQGVTAKGKTWSGTVTPLPSKWRSTLQAIVRRFDWHGGGALEFIRDPQARLWLIDVNPRFPSWIYGAALCGSNLPAQLISAASGVQALESPHQSNAFSRVVLEVAVRPAFASHLGPQLVD